MPRATKKPKIDSSNDELADLLLEIGNYERLRNKQIYKFNAYRKAAQSIKSFPKKIKTIDEVKNLSGIGKNIQEIIKQYLEEGKIELIEQIRNDDKAKSIAELAKVSGIGPTVAEKLFKQGIKSLDELRLHQDKLTHAQKIGLKYIDELKEPIPRKEMIQMEEFIKKTVKSLDNDYIVTLCGSFRRGAETSDDVDVLLAHPNYVSVIYARESKKKTPGLIVNNPKPIIDKIVKELIRLKFITDTMAFGETKFMGVCKLKDKVNFRELNMRLIPFDQYYCGILYYTGSDMFNKKLRKEALEAGCTLNEYSLRKLTPRGIPGKALEVKSEEDIFKHIGVPYVKPEEREIS